MIYKKELLILILIIISTVGKNLSPISYEVDRTVANSVENVKKVDLLKESKLLLKKIDFAKHFKDLRRNHSPEEMRIIGTLGLLSGALRVEKSMRENLYYMTNELLDSFDISSPKQNMQKLLAIEETINRDKSATSILNGMLKYARNLTTLDALEKDMQHILKENVASSKRLRSKKLTIGTDDDQKVTTTGKLINRSGINLKYIVNDKLIDVKEMIDNHVENIHSSVTDSVKQTIRHIQRVQKANQKLMQPNKKQTFKLDPSLIPVRRIWDQVSTRELEKIESDFGMTLNYRPRSSKIFRIIQEPRLTKGEELTAVVITPKPNIILVDTNADRFKRQTRSDPDMPLMVDIELDFDEPKMDTRKGKNKNEDDNEIDGNKTKGEKEIGEQNEEEFDEEDTPSEQQGGLVGLITNLSGGGEGSDIGAVLGAISQVVSRLLGPGGLDIPGIVSSSTSLLSALLAGEENFGKYLGDIFGLAIDGFSGGGGAANNGEFFGQFIGKFISALSADPDDDEAPIQPKIFIESLYDGIGKGSANPEEREGDQPDCVDNGGSDSSGFIKGVLNGLIHVISRASAGSSAGLSQGSIQGVTGLSGGSSSGSSSGSSKGHEECPKPCNK